MNLLSIFFSGTSMPDVVDVSVPSQAPEMASLGAIVVSVAVCVVLEFGLRKAERSIMKNWWFVFALMIVWIAQFIWSGWVNSFPMEEALLNRQAGSLVRNVTLYAASVLIVEAMLVSAGVWQCVREYFASGPVCLALRLAPIVPVVVLLIRAFADGNAMVGEDGLLSVIMNRT